ncbi:hypothetical protein BDV25DRAFT_172767 [Aspergillus avenaceus]|uniref:RING-type domain-containing protein n=1 Tax=Aspergillus avenaceus TaxID=36643 RepID=A0A5N6TTF2_ASPAV|nr:hypothetical protein BDV25DRAFT_172767 [Aspergillus avenaceus]
MPDWTVGSSPGTADVHPDNSLTFQVLLVVCLSVYVLTAIWLLIRSYCLAYSSSIPTVNDSTANDARPPTNMEQRLQFLERAAPTKPFKTWWMSVQTIKSPLKKSDQLFTCSICLDTVHRKDPIHALKCRHVFHRQCLEKWYLGDHNHCPVCHKAFFEEPPRDPGLAV